MIGKSFFDRGTPRPIMRIGNHGAVLVSGLMIMAGLTILGIAAMTTTTIEPLTKEWCH